MSDAPLSEAGEAAMNVALEALVPLCDLDEQLRILDGMRGMLTDGRAPSYEALLDLLQHHAYRADETNKVHRSPAVAAALRAAGRSTE